MNLMNYNTFLCILNMKFHIIILIFLKGWGVMDTYVKHKFQLYENGILKLTIIYM